MQLLGASRTLVLVCVQLFQIFVFYGKDVFWALFFVCEKLLSIRFIHVMCHIFKLGISGCFRVSFVRSCSQYVFMYVMCHIYFQVREGSVVVFEANILRKVRYR